MPGRPTIWITVGQGPTALAVGAGGGCLEIFTLIYPFFPLSPSLWETARYRLKYCLKGPLNPKQPTNQLKYGSKKKKKKKKKKKPVEPRITKKQTRISPFPTNLNESINKLHVGPIIESDARPTGVQLKREAKLSVATGLV